MIWKDLSKSNVKMRVCEASSNKIDDNFIKTIVNNF